MQSRRLFPLLIIVALRRRAVCPITMIHTIPTKSSTRPSLKSLARLRTSVATRNGDGTFFF
jgi:hypothetical protein